MSRAGRPRLGRLSTFTDPGTLRDAFAELVATAIFVFAAEGATLSLGKGGLVSVALAHALALAAAVACTMNISGGHVNPAITFGAFLSGQVCLVRSIVYWTGQLIGAVTAALLLRITTGGVHLAEHTLAAGVEGWHAAVLEAAMAFGLMYAYHATAVDPRRARAAGIIMAPLAVGLLAGANVLACGPFDGAVMNPARAFGPAIVGSRRWANQWVYWMGPMAGAGLASLVYEHIVINPADDKTKTN
ncbi:hypothetical protein EJB05_08285 [Eragrostis curvula]|uniref:Aquaporin n=1 Tax=Eragrostis curvula TaxID=38414 RepID=A0A5J9WMZ6_9POAL|nr:hypothetical protein EJB05_08285 [Eragrostis curvula]